MALSRGSHVRVPKPIFPSQVAPMDQRAGLCVFAPPALPARPVVRLPPTRDSNHAPMERSTAFEW